MTTHKLTKINSMKRRQPETKRTRDKRSKDVREDFKEDKEQEN